MGTSDVKHKIWCNSCRKQYTGPMLHDLCTSCGGVLSLLPKPANTQPKCPRCAVPGKRTEPGRYRCTKCNAFFEEPDHSLEDLGHVSNLKICTAEELERRMREHKRDMGKRGKKAKEPNDK
jgi:rRNA maturation endonuclease Nob1